MLDIQRLPAEVQTMVEEIEAFAGRPIEYVFNPVRAVKLWGEKVDTCCLWISSEQAAIIAAIPNPPPRSIVHEILHVRSRWLEGRPSLWAPPGHKEPWIQGFDNELEHLFIVPEEQKFLDDDGWWEGVYGNPAPRLHKIPALRRHLLLMGWLMASQLLPVKSHEMWQHELSELNLDQEAKSFATAVMGAFPHKGAMWAIVIDFLGLQRPWLQLKTCDPRAGVDHFSELT